MKGSSAVNGNVTVMISFKIMLCVGSIVRVIKIEKNEMGGACSAYRGEERRIQGFGGET